MRVIGESQEACLDAYDMVIREEERQGCRSFPATRNVKAPSSSRNGIDGADTNFNQDPTGLFLLRLRDTSSTPPTEAISNTSPLELLPGTLAANAF